MAGTGTSSNKSTDVLVTNGATAITSASGLANQRFSFYREDCFQGGTNPPTFSQSLTFDANGNAALTDSSGTKNYSAAAITGALNGQAIFDAASGKYTVFHAYSFAKQDGSKAYVIVEHDAPALTGFTKAVLATWTQQ